MAKEQEGGAEKITHGNIYAALSAFQGELKPMDKTGHVEFPTQKGTVKFDYTPLGDIMKTIYPLLAKHGLSVRHEISKDGVEAILTHETYKRGSGTVSDEVREDESEGKQVGDDSMANVLSHKMTSHQYVERIDGEIRSGVVGLKAGSEMKDTGAAITYARRYTLTMLLGIASEDDKDAELLEASAKNAVSFAYGRAKEKIETAKTRAELGKAMEVINRDLALVKENKPGALGLQLAQYEELVELAEAKGLDLEK